MNKGQSLGDNISVVIYEIMITCIWDSKVSLVCVYWSSFRRSKNFFFSSNLPFIKFNAVQLQYHLD